MGNFLSNNIHNGDNNESLLKEIDEIATKYIFKQNIIDMLRFSDKNYRENFVILTSHILEKKLSNLHIDALKERVLTPNKNSKNTNYGDIVYFSELEKLKPLLSDENTKKKALLIISKFYIKIFTLFGSIVSVIDPQYVYKDENDEEKFFYLKNFDDLKMIDTNTNKLRVYHLENPLTLVKRRLFILKNKMEQQENGDYVVLNPGEELCKMNISENNNSDIFHLSNEIGIKELDDLYYDLYDEDSATWSERSDEMKEQYEKDVTLFYQIFTGKKDKPPNVTSFGDIELLDFHNLKRCKNNDYFEDLLVSKNDELFQKYLTKIGEIQQGTRSHKKQLLYILNSLFAKKNNTENEEDYEYIIHSELNMETLLEKQKQIKNCIIQMYSSCEKNFIEALLLYEKMYENRHGELIENQINNINFNNNSKNNQNVNNLQESLQNDNLVLNGDLLLDNKIKMPNINNNEFIAPNVQSEKYNNLQNNIPQPMPLQENNDNSVGLNNISTPSMPPQENGNAPMETNNMPPQENGNAPMETNNMPPQENGNAPMETNNMPPQENGNNSVGLNNISTPPMLSQENGNNSMKINNISPQETYNAPMQTNSVAAPPMPPQETYNAPMQTNTVAAPQQQEEEIEQEVQKKKTKNDNNIVTENYNNKDKENTNKISLNMNSSNNKIKNKESLADKGIDAQKSIINSLSNFFS